MSPHPIGKHAFSPFRWRRAKDPRYGRSAGRWWAMVMVAAAILCGGPRAGGAAGFDEAEPDDTAGIPIITAVDRLWEMDANGDGLLAPDEIPDDALAQIEQWAELAGLDPSGPMSLVDLEDALWAALDEGRPAIRPLNPISPSEGDGEPAGLEFGAGGDLDLVPGFGDGEADGASVSRADRDTAAEWLSRYDRNRDRSIDRNEVRRLRVRGDAMEYDTNRNGRLDERELAKLAARQRIDDSSSADQRPPQDQRRQRDQNQQQNPRQSRQQSRDSGRGSSDAESWGLAGSMLNRYDLNGDNSLSPAELQSLGEWARSADADGDGEVSRRELGEWLTERNEVAPDTLPLGLPSWFRARDTNGDRQIAMHEFTDDWTEESVEEFASYDADDDGILSVEECLTDALATEDAFSNTMLRTISPGAVVFSEITVAVTAPISDLDVRISITHPEDRDLDIFLVDPQGQEVELCTGVGGTRDHFDDTIFDDEARTSIARGRAPFRGPFQSEAASRKQPSLSQYYGKSIEGAWTLMIRAERSDQPGALHSWSLMPTFEEQPEH